MSEMIDRTVRSDLLCLCLPCDSHEFISIQKSEAGQKASWE